MSPSLTEVVDRDNVRMPKPAGSTCFPHETHADSFISSLAPLDDFECDRFAGFAVNRLEDDAHTTRT
jgi:hypothetical protein